MAAHKHKEWIIAWANGAEIEYKYRYEDKWRMASTPNWDSTLEYRIKPKEMVKRYKIAYKNPISEDLNFSLFYYKSVEDFLSQGNRVVEWAVKLEPTMKEFEE